MHTHTPSKNLILIGMPGAGKSTIGVLTAKALGMDFIDTDVVIQQAAGRLLPEIIAEDGIEEFLEIEGEVLSSLELQETVVATGGSAVMRPEALRTLSIGGHIVYLSVPLEEIERRVTNIADRGIAMPADQDLRTLYADRDPRYRAVAHTVLECGTLDIEGTVHALCELQQSRGRA